MITRLTADMLDQADACAFERTRFHQLYPDGVDITVDVCVEAAAEWDWNWAQKHLLNEAGQIEYQKAGQSAWDQYEKAMEPARIACATAQQKAGFVYDNAQQEAIGPNYDSDMEPVRAEYTATVQAAGDAYGKIQESASIELTKHLAACFAKAVLKHGIEIQRPIEEGDDL